MQNRNLGEAVGNRDDGRLIDASLPPGANCSRSATEGWRKSRVPVGEGTATTPGAPHEPSPNIKIPAAAAHEHRRVMVRRANRSLHMGDSQLRASRGHKIIAG